MTLIPDFTKIDLDDAGVRPGESVSGVRPRGSDPMHSPLVGSDPQGLTPSASEHWLTPEGIPVKPVYTAAGVDQFLFAGQDALEVLKGLHERLA